MPGTLVGAGSKSPRNSAGALGFIGNAVVLFIAVAWTLVAIAASICLLPLGFLFSLLSRGEAPPAPDLLLPTPPPPQALVPQALPPWMEVARTVVVWVLVIGMVLYVVVQFLRDRPELTRALRELALGRRLRQLWAAFRHRASGLERVPRRRGFGDMDAPNWEPTIEWVSTGG